MSPNELPLKGRSGRRLVGTILRPLHENAHWKARLPARGEYCFDGGLVLAGTLPAEEGVLDTAREDFITFLQEQNLGKEEPAICRLKYVNTLAWEEHEIHVSADGVEVRAGDTEGIRRALFWIQDEMLKRGGPFLPVGTHRRKAVIRTRISRCFFGPINRPPANRDELEDDVNYYPEPYLNRLAHDGANVLWITIKFRDTVPSKIFPEIAPNGARRLAKLRDTVKRCARYGIRVYVFCIEPDSLTLDSPLLVQYPELKGHVIDSRAAFCVSSRIGKRYLVEAAQTLFESVPGLGGMIVIPVGERFTQCSSIAQPESGTTEERCNCRRCSRMAPQDVLYDTLEALRRGMNAADPSAELISWPYGQLIMWGEDLTVRAAGHVPKGVILQHNFETGGSVRQLGKDRALWDYWLSVVGPSPAFASAARAALANGARVSAKLQVGCSHEDATVPFLPVPGLLHAKYRRMHELGVSSVMQSWYFGNYPSLMTHAAGQLSFAPLMSEKDFLHDLAARTWGGQSGEVVDAWSYFRQAYEQYPAAHLFGYYGPVQDGLTWPLHLIPRNRPLSPTWKLGYPPSGDFLADCLSSAFTLDEAATLCARMSEGWNVGLRSLGEAFRKSSQTSAQRQEWDVAQAIGLQFENAAEILEFYQLRERLAELTGKEATLVLDAMSRIVDREMKRRRKMILLCEREPTLGFHSEAEGFKFTPALIRRGLRSLERLLRVEFPAVRRSAARGGGLFLKYTGRDAKRILQVWREFEVQEEHNLRHLLTQGSAFPGRSIKGTDWSRGKLVQVPIRVSFLASMRKDALHVIVNSPVPSLPLPWTTTVIVEVEPRRLHPRIQFIAEAAGCKIGLVDDGYLMKEKLPFEVDWVIGTEGWSGTFSIPLKSARLRKSADLFRFNVRAVYFNKETNERWELSWMRRSPLKPRLAWEDANPATDYGWAQLGSK